MCSFRSAASYQVGVCVTSHALHVGRFILDDGTDGGGTVILN